VLICWRMLRGKSGAWLINANAGAALLVLVASCGIDLGAVAAAWNVRYARDVGGQGPKLDVCYLQQLGPSALVSLVEAERRSTSPDLIERVALAREDVWTDLKAQQSDWRSWTPRDALRLRRMDALKQERPLAQSVRAYRRDYDGCPVVPPPPAPVPAPEPVAEAPPPVPPAPAASSPLTQNAEH